MNQQQLDLIPDATLRSNRRYGAADLIDYLAARGLRMTLLELHDERVRRGFANDRSRKC